MSSGIWVHFQQTDEKKIGSYKVVCKHCYTGVACCSGSTSNLHKHLRRNHPEAKVGPRITKHGKIIPSSKTTKGGVLTTPKKSDLTHDKHQHINDALVRFVSCDLIPLSVIDSPYFRGMLQAANPNYEVPTRKHLVDNLLQERYNEVKLDVKSRLDMADWVSVTLDVWSSHQMRSYIGITGHIIHDWTLNNVVLSCKRLNGYLTAQDIMPEFEEIRRQFNIGSKVTNIVTDNTSLAISAFSLPGFAEMSTSLVKDKDDGDIDDLDITTETDPELYEVLPTDHSSCFAYSLELVIKDGFASSENLNDIIKKVSKLVCFVHISNVVTDILEGENTTEPIHESRWNSQLKMIRSVMRVPDEKLNMIGAIPILSAYDRSVLTDMLMILEPFEEATDCTQRHNCASASFVIPCVRGLRFHLRNIHSNYNNALVFDLLKSIEKKLQSYEDNKVYQLAAVLDPRFKLAWCNSEKEKVTIKSNLATQAYAMETTASPSVPVVGESSSAKKRKKLFSFMDSPSFCSEPLEGTQRRNVINMEMDKYLNQSCLSEDSDVMGFWKNHKDVFPQLAQVAKRYLTVPASSTSVEKAFSISGKTFPPDRCHMTDANFETIMFIKCNQNVS